MIINIVKKKASSLKAINLQQIEISNVKTLKELLIALSIYEYEQLFQNNKLEILKSNDIVEQGKLGKVKFSTLYNNEKEDLNKVIEVMLQDYQDGLFRVYLDGQECTKLDEQIDLKDGCQVVLIRLVMLAGRLW